MRDGERIREKERERQRAHRKRSKAAGVQRAQAAEPVVSRPEFELEVTVDHRDKVEFLCRRVSELKVELRGLSRTVLEVSSGLASGSRREFRGG